MLREIDPQRPVDLGSREGSVHRVGAREEATPRGGPGPELLAKQKSDGTPHLRHQRGERARLRGPERPHRHVERREPRLAAARDGRKRRNLDRPHPVPSVGVVERRPRARAGACPRTPATGGRSRAHGDRARGPRGRPWPGRSSALLRSSSGFRRSSRPGRPGAPGLASRPRGPARRGAASALATAPSPPRPKNRETARRSDALRTRSYRCMNSPSGRCCVAQERGQLGDRERVGRVEPGAGDLDECQDGKRRGADVRDLANAPSTTQRCAPQLAIRVAELAGRPQRGPRQVRLSECAPQPEQGSTSPPRGVASRSPGASGWSPRRSGTGNAPRHRRRGRETLRPRWLRRADRAPSRSPPALEARAAQSSRDGAGPARWSQKRSARIARARGASTPTVRSTPGTRTPAR